MKKLFLGICIAFAISACNQTSVESEKSTGDEKILRPTEKAPPPVGNTLDGLTYKDAAEMVKNFTDNTNSSDDITCIWYSSAWVKKVKAQLENEQTNDSTIDGFRVYFAKTAAGKNTLVVVATKRTGKNPTYPNGYIHSDHFIQTNTTITRGTADFLEEYTTNLGTSLADPLYKCTGSCTVTTFNNRISCDMAFKYVQGFKNQPINTTALWFPIELIKVIDNELDEALKVIPADGIHIYYARDEKNRNTLVIATTQKVHQNGVDYHQDYSECHMTNKSILDEFNRGEKCPNYCDGVNLPCDTCEEKKTQIARTKK